MPPETEDRLLAESDERRSFATPPESVVPAPRRHHRFPKAARLLKRRQFLALSDRTARPDMKIQAGVFLIIGRLNGLGHSRLGVTATRKTGSAVTRNMIKRLIRELFRLNGHRWPAGLDMVFIARAGAGNFSKAVLAADLAKADRKIAAWRLPAASEKNSTPGVCRPKGDRISPPPAVAAEDGAPYESPLGSLDFLRAIPMCLALGLIFVYKRFISPLLPHVCRFWPTCSDYAASAIKIHGFWRGSLLAALRLLKCHPLHPGGYDPVPPRKE